MVSTSARNAGGPWFDSRSRHDRFCTLILFVYIISCIAAFSVSSIPLPDAVELL